MKIAVFTAVDRIELEDRPVPRVEPGSVLVRVSVCGICGSDVAALRGSGHKKYPYSPGHEFCGVIQEVGSEVDGISVGERVVIDPNLGCGECRYCREDRPNLCDVLKGRHVKSNGGLAEYVALDHRMAHRLPVDFSDELATFVEPLSCALHISRVADVQPGERAAVMGAGLMGTLTAVVTRRDGVEVLIVEPAARRRERAARLLGIEALAPEALDASPAAGALDCVIDMSGSAHAIAQAVRVLRKAGRLVLAGLVTEPRSADIFLVDVTAKELEIRGAWLNPLTFSAAIDAALAHRDVLEALPTETFPLEDIETAFKRAAGEDAPKVLVRPSRTP